MVVPAKRFVGVIFSTLLVLHFVAVSSADECTDEYCGEAEETNVTPATCEARLLEKEDEVWRTRDELAQSQTQFEKNRAIMAQQEAELAEQAVELAQTRAQLAESRTKLAATEKVLANTSATLAVTRAGLDETLATLTETKEELANTTATLVATRTELTNTYAILTATKAELAETKTALLDKNATLVATTTELAETKTVLVDTNFSLVATTTELAETKTILFDINATLVRTTAELVDTKTAVIDMNATLVATTAELAETKTVLVDKNATLVTTTTELLRTKTALVDANATLVATATELAETKTVLVDTNASLVATTTELAETKTILGNTNATVVVASTELAETKTLLVDTNTTLVATTAELVQAKTILVDTNASLVATTTELAETKTIVFDINATLLATNTELAETQTTLVDTNATLVRTTAALVDTKTAVIDMNATLVATTTELAETKTVLVDTSASLMATELELSEMKILQANTNAILVATDTELAKTKRKLSESETEMAKMAQSLQILERDLQKTAAELQERRTQNNYFGTIMAKNNASLEWALRTSKVLMSALLTLNSTRAAKIPAQVPEPKIWEALNQSANFSCNSNGPPLSLCMWSHRVEDRLEVTLLNRHGWYISTDGIRLSSEGDLNDGKCSVRIRSVTKDKLGLWTCALVVVGADQVLSGQVELQSEPKPVASEPYEPTIYFATQGDGINKFSMGTSQVTTMWHSGRLSYGIALDTAKNTLYWTFRFHIYRARINQTQTETLLPLFKGTKLDSPRGLAYDWIAANLYVSTWGGSIFACNDNDRGATTAFRCSTVLGGPEMLTGIAVDPNEGFIYYSRTVDTNPYCILKAGTDGSSPTGMVKCAEGANGIQIDYQAKRLYWAEYYVNKIRSSDLDGSAIITVALTPAPYGVALVGQRIYWGQYSSGQLQSMSVLGTGIRSEANASAHTRNLVYSNWNPPKNRSNHCEQQICAGVCVLSRTSFKCLKQR